MALNIIYNKNFNDIKDAVRRITNDLDTGQVAVQEHQLSELVIGQFVIISHEAGADPRSPQRPTSEASELGYSILPGEYQIPVEDSADIVAIDSVYTNISTTPLRFTPRHEMDIMIQNDIQRLGAVQRGDPVYWTWIWKQGTKSGNIAAIMQHQLQVYPAASRAYTVYWPRTIVDAATMDPSLTTGRPPFSYLLQVALVCKVGSLCIQLSTDDSLKRNNIDRRLADQLWKQYQDSLQLEKNERNSHWQRDHIVGLQS